VRPRRRCGRHSGYDLVWYFQRNRGGTACRS
jgi:hypothetical protein